MTTNPEYYALFFMHGWRPAVATLVVCFQVAQMADVPPQYDWNLILGDGSSPDFGYWNSSSANYSPSYDDGYDPSATLPVSMTGSGRVNCINGNSKYCCAEPYEPKILNGKEHCCKPNAKLDVYNCCPKELIPAREPNMDPFLGPFCCNASTGHCCTRDLVFGYDAKPQDGRCCVNTSCCPRPLFPRHQGKYCCSGSWSNSIEAYCCLSSWIFEWPIPRCCSPRDFCCPLPYTLRYFRPPDYRPDNACFSPGKKNPDYCTLPLIPSQRKCIEQQPLPLPSRDRDTPYYDLSYPKFSHRDPSKTVVFTKPQCLQSEVIREIFGNKYYVKTVEAAAVPINWHVTRTNTPRTKPVLTNDTMLDPKRFFWPEFIIPYLFPVSIVLICILSVVPLLILSAIGWAIIYNFRFFTHKKIRMVIRGMLIYFEKRRRNFQYHCLPLQHFLKFRQQDRYQMPKAFQDSDLSSDDEPAELQWDQQVTAHAETMWTQEEIDRLGFDPDHIPLEWIYGDLLGKSEQLKPEVRNYNARKTRERDGGLAGMNAAKSLDSEEWHDFVRSNTKDKEKKEGYVLNNVWQNLKKMRRSSSRARSSSSEDLVKASRARNRGGLKKEKATIGKKRQR